MATYHFRRLTWLTRLGRAKLPMWTVRHCTRPGRPTHVDL